MSFRPKCVYSMISHCWVPKDTYAHLFYSCLHLTNSVRKQCCRILVSRIVSVFSYSFRFIQVDGRISLTPTFFPRSFLFCLSSLEFVNSVVGYWFLLRFPFYTGRRTNFSNPYFLPTTFPFLFIITWNRKQCCRILVSRIVSVLYRSTDEFL